MLNKVSRVLSSFTLTDGYLDADECWVELLNSMSNAPLAGIVPSDDSLSTSKFVDQYLAGEMTKT